MEDERYREARAELGVAFPMSLESKMLLTVGTLLFSTLAAPAAYVRRDEIRELEFEGAAALPETLSLFAGVVILIGNVSTFFIGLVLLKYVRARSGTSPATREEIEKQLRVEDFVMWFQLWGTILIIPPVLLLALAAVFPGIIEPMYDVGITIYRPFELVTLDMRLVTGITGGGLGLLLGAMWWLVK